VAKLRKALTSIIYLTRSHYIINDESVKKRNKNMFGGIMSYLKKAKTTLEKDESTVIHSLITA
jgi:hypothetical protein